MQIKWPSNSIRIRIRAISGVWIYSDICLVNIWIQIYLDICSVHNVTSEYIRIFVCVHFWYSLITGGIHPSIVAFWEYMASSCYGDTQGSKGPEGAGSRLSPSQSLPGKSIIWGIFPAGDIVPDYCPMTGEDRKMTGSSDSGYSQGRGDKVRDPLYRDNTVIVTEILS